MAHSVSNPSHQNHYFKNDLCYTEDHIPVHKIYLYNIPSNMKDEKLLSHFKSYGHVVGMRVYASGKPRPLFHRASSKKNQHQEQQRTGKWQLKTGWVLFRDPRDAAIALYSRIHNVSGKRFHVQASDSWHQPDAYGTSELQIAQTEEAHILRISDPCLLKILKYLSVADQIHFSRVCMRFRGVYQLVTRTLHRTVDVTKFDGLTVWDMRDFFLLSGEFIQNFEGVIPPMRSERLCNFFAINCVNVKSMELWDSKLSPRNVTKLFANAEKLENLVLSNCALTDASLVALKKCKNLKKLSLAHNPKLNGFDLDKLPVSIETLNLMACSGIQSTRLLQMCRVLTNLKDLNIIGVNHIYFSLFEFLAKRRLCRNLETLRLSVDHHSKHEEIAKLPNLKNIHIAVLPGMYIRAKLFNQLIEHKSEQLEELEIYGAKNMTKPLITQISKLTGLQKLVLDRVEAINDDVLDELTKLKKLKYISLRWCSHVSDTAVLRLILGCPKLNEFHLEDCPEISEKLVLTIIKKVQHQILYKENERKLPIHMYVQGTKIEKSIETHPEVVAAKNLIKFFFTSNIGEDLLHIFTLSYSFLDEYDYNPNELGLGTDDELDFFDDHYLFEMGFLSESDVDSDFDSDDLDMLMNNPPYVHPSYPYDGNDDFFRDSDSD